MSAAGAQLASLLASEPAPWNSSDSPQHRRLSAAAARPHFDVNSEWSSPGRPQSVQFDPLLRSALFHSIGRHRAYYPLLLLLIVVSMLFVLQPWLSAHTKIVLQLFLVCALWVPILLVECTRLDRRLLLHLIESFDFWFLMANWCTCEVMVFLNSTDSFASVGNAVSLNLVYFFFSLFTFGMDALPEVKPKFKIVWLSVFTGWMIYHFVQNRAEAQAAQAEEGRFCVFFCTSTHSIIASTLITQIAFAVKYLVHLIRSPNRLMIVRPHAIISMQDEARAINQGAI